MTSLHGLDPGSLDMIAGVRLQRHHLEVRGSRIARRFAFIRTLFRAYRSAYSGLPRDVWLVSGVLLINRAGTMVLPFFALFLTNERGLSLVDAGKLLSLYGVGAASGSFLGGWLSDRIGSTRTQHITLLLAGIGYVSMTQIEGLAAIAVTIYLLATVAEAFRPAAMTAIAERAPEGRHVQAFALLRLAANIGMAIGPAVGGLLAVYSYDWLFYGDAATCWLASVALFLVIGTGQKPVAHDTATPVERPLSPWRDGPFLGLLVLVFLLACVVFQIFSTLPLYFEREFGLREDGIGLLLGLNALLIVMFEMVLVQWAQRHRRMRIIGIGTFITCIGLGVMPLGHSVGFLALSVAIWTLGEMMSLPLMSAVVAERARHGSYGRYMGMYSFSFSAAFIVAPATGVWVFHHWGSTTLWFGVGALGVPMWGLALALANSFKREKGTDLFSR